MSGWAYPPPLKHVSECHLRRHPPFPAQIDNDDESIDQTILHHVPELQGWAGLCSEFQPLVKLHHTLHTTPIHFCVAAPPQVTDEIRSEYTHVCWESLRDYGVSPRDGPWYISVFV